MHHSSQEIDYRSVLLPLDGKLWGSRARRLAEDLEALFHEGYDQVVLDLRACSSLDSVSGIAMREALDHGQRLLLITGPAMGTSDLPPEVAEDGRIRVFSELGDAIRHVRSRDESGVLVPE